jgi:hypothetical protein
MSNRKNSELVKAALEKARATSQSKKRQNPDYQKAIRFVQENYSPSMSYSKLAAELNLAGIKSLRGGVWSSTTARALVLSLK